jgi:hypothetical protein
LATYSTDSINGYLNIGATMKRRFNFEPIDTLVDVFLNGYKVREKHRGQLGQICIHAEDGDEVELKPHDPRIPIQATFDDDGKFIILELEPVKEVEPIRVTYDFR